MDRAVRTRGRPKKTVKDIATETFKKRTKNVKDKSKDVVAEGIKKTKKDLKDELSETLRDLVKDPSDIKKIVKKRGKNALKIVSENVQEGAGKVYDRVRKEVKGGAQEFVGRSIDTVAPKRKRGRPRRIQN